MEAKIPADFNAFVDHLGIPENTSLEDYIKGEYKFLAWEKGEFEIFINKVHAGKEHRNHFIAKVFNFPEYYDTVDTRLLGDQ